MFGLFRRKPPQDNAAVIISELEHVYGLIASLTIPVVSDDFDAAYDMAVDEALDIIDGRIRFYATPTPTMENDA